MKEELRKRNAALKAATKAQPCGCSRQLLSFLRWARRMRSRNRAVGIQPTHCVLVLERNGNDVGDSGNASRVARANELSQQLHSHGRRSCCIEQHRTTLFR
jgi:hypothetical protein